MTPRSKKRLAWGLAALAIVLMLAAEVVGRSTGESTHVFIWSIAITFAGVGALIASRHSDNAIGWLFLGAAVSAGIGYCAGAYAEHWLDSGDGPALLGKTAAAYSSISWIPWILVPSTFLLLLFPDGHLLSRRWRWVSWCAAGGLALGFVTQGLRAGPLEDYPEVTNPYGVDGLVIDLLSGLAVFLIVVGIVGSSASLIVRFRRARGEQRQQMKWIAFAGAVAGVCVIVFTITYDEVGEAVANSGIMLGVLCLPLAAGLAILRYRLYDIDVVINRTLVYGALSATLVGAYLGSVLLLQLLLNGVTGNSGLAVAASTLAVAALVRPARARIQAAVDRRFFRRKYDAAQTLEEFSARLRDQLDLGTLNTELSSVVHETLQPAHVSVWLRRAD
jgi:hypothetical protein